MGDNIEIPFMGGAYTARSTALNAQVCQNLYPEIDKTGAKSVISLTNTPGFKLWHDFGVAGEVRGFSILNDLLYVVVGDTLYSIDTGTNETNLGTINTSSGFCDITNDGYYLGIFDSSGGFSYNVVDGLAEITASALPTPSGATYQDGRHIVTEAGTQNFYISSLDAANNADPTTWDALNFETAETNGDDLVSPRSVRRQLWLFGKFSTEIWYFSGADFPFDLNPGGILNIGCGAKRSITDFEDVLFWLDNKGRIVRSQGLNYKPISTYHIDYQISLLSKSERENAVGFTYFQEGHIFYEITIGTKTFCYDVTTDLWHTRATGVTDNRNRSNCYIYFGDKHLIGDYQDGKLFELDLDTYADDGEVMRAIRTCQVIEERNHNMFFYSFELEMEVGVGIATGQGSDPQLMLQWSDDGGKTWSNEHWLSIGKMGEYKTRVRKRRLGVSRNRIFRTIISDPVKRRFFNAYVEGEIGSI
jgi:hypothetical protein